MLLVFLLTAAFSHPVTRSHKANDRDHSAVVHDPTATGGAGGSGSHPTGGGAPPEAHLPRYFSKHGPIDADPKKTKKDGGGKGNWGRDGDEVEDYSYNLTNPRRRSNSSTHPGRDFKSKFEMQDQEPVFEEGLHGPPQVAVPVEVPVPVEGIVAGPHAAARHRRQAENRLATKKDSSAESTSLSSSSLSGHSLDEEDEEDEDEEGAVDHGGKA
ncbi:MAG: hypothetical protein M1826_005679 [Phylliscum demangeonii]|nr:MAG: hypothetical protein M1826_005679 [Phylliscum demangeonii]